MYKKLMPVCLLIFLLGGFLFAQEAAEATVTVAESGSGKILADAKGMSLYLFTKDTESTSNCYDQCAENWPPLLVEGEPTAGKGIAPTLLGTTQRTDGSLQVTYNKLPLYYFVKDVNPGETAGQGVGEVWYLVSPYGVAVEVASTSTETATATPAEETGTESSGPAMDVMTLANLKGEGKGVYEGMCATCHDISGEGGEGPKLVGNSKLADAGRIARQIINGGHFMPPFGDKLSDHQISTVLTYIRTSWGNDFGPVLDEEVNAER